MLPTLTALFLSEEGTEGESGEKEEKEGSRGVSNSQKLARDKSRGGSGAAANGGGWLGSRVAPELSNVLSGETGGIKQNLPAMCSAILWPCWLPRVRSAGGSVPRVGRLGRV